MTTEATPRPTTGQETPTSVRRVTDDLLQRVEHTMRSFLSAECARFAEVDERAVVVLDALSDLVASGGKRVRPEFCITGYLAAAW